MDYNALAQHLLAEEHPHSAPFIEGMAAVLRNRVENQPVKSQYPLGSVEEDAFFAGRLRAFNEFRNLAEDQGGNAGAVERLKAIAAARRAA